MSFYIILIVFNIKRMFPLSSSIKYSSDEEMIPVELSFALCLKEFDRFKLSQETYHSDTNKNFALDWMKQICHVHMSSFPTNISVIYHTGSLLRFLSMDWK